MNAPPLVDQIARLIERTYDIDAGVVPLGRFVVGDEGHRRLVAGRVVREQVGNAPASHGARLLLRPLGDDEAGRMRWAVALHLPDDLVELLERHDPRRVLGEANIDGFATLVEEIDHLVTTAERFAAGAEVSLLELEWHAAVTKSLVLSHFVGRLGGSTRLGAEVRAFVDYHVFHKLEFNDPDPDVRARYRDAHRLGWRLMQRLRNDSVAGRIATLRRFHRASPREKLERFAG